MTDLKPQPQIMQKKMIFTSLYLKAYYNVFNTIIYLLNKTFIKRTYAFNVHYNNANMCIKFDAHSLFLFFRSQLFLRGIVRECQSIVVHDVKGSKLIGPPLATIISKI